MAESTLTNEGRMYKSDSFGFGTFIGYVFYDWLDTFGLAPPCMTKMKEIHEIRLESCEQLDPTYVLKRIRHLEDISRVLMK